MNVFTNVPPDHHTPAHCFSVRSIVEEAYTTAAKAPRGPELFFGLVGAIGTDLGLVASALQDALRSVSYETTVVRLSNLLKDLPGNSGLRDSPLDARYDDYMRAGTTLRDETSRDDAVALLAVQSIRGHRTAAMESSDDSVPALSRHAFVLWSLKRPEEVEALRNIYGPGFFLVAAYAPRESREKHLRLQIADSYHAAPDNKHARIAEDLMEKDEKEYDQRRGQNVRDTFPKADVFVDVSGGQGGIRAHIDHFIALLFGYPFHTPTRDEHAMFHAQASALRSAEFGRQVGAAITLTTGEVVAVGVNEVPRASGGPYWPPEPCVDDDHREFTLGSDTSEKMKRSNLAEILRILVDNNLLTSEANDREFDALLAKCLLLMKGTRLMNATEFGRAVHAEMDAITEAARRGIAIKECTLYTTTFPCHNCARHIVATGLRKVVYIEPYAKSLASDFHDDSIAVDRPATSNQVGFVPFVGIAPRLYMQLFQMVQRKSNVDGHAVQWDKQTAVPRLLPPVLRYIDLEINASKGLKDAMDKPRTTGASGGE